ncbi:prolyl oligopeptidase family serine peptidase [Actinomadura sp. DSM 109109]|nr:prolyl oligopeptidase family serine peptidase [Actinomadura lepetitiana]
MSETTSARSQPASTGVEYLHGRAVPDPYRWLEDGSAPACRTWLAGQAERFADHARTWAGRSRLRALVAAEAEQGGSAVPAVSPPVLRGERRFFQRRRPGQQLPVLVVADPHRGERVLLDPLSVDATGRTTLDAWRPSPSGDRVAVQLSHQGGERPVLRVLETATSGWACIERRPGRVSPIVWCDEESLLYVTTDHRTRERCLRSCRLGTSGDGDPVLFSTRLAQLAVTASPDGRLLMISAAAGPASGNLLWLAPAPVQNPVRDRGELARVLVHDGTRDGSRAVLKFAPGGRIYAVTNAGAPWGRLCAVDPGQPHRTAWRTLLEQEEGDVLGDCAMLTDGDTGRLYLLLVHNRHGISRIRLHTADGLPVRDAPLPGDGHVSRLTSPAHGGPHAWFTYTDFTTPPTVMRFDLDRRACAPETPPPAASPPWARVHEVDYPSRDRTPVRMRIIAPPGADGPRPLILVGYGGFGTTVPPAFAPTLTAWVRAGGVYAVASLRGGGEKGRQWHAAGSGANKPAAIADFIAAAEWLVEHGWTTPGRLAIRGNSHSGLMVAAALTRRPDLYAAAVCSDALTDMVRYHRAGMGHLWAGEFGTADDPDELDTLLGYSPYHRVRRGTHYPAVLLTCPAVDPRVDSLHTRKMTAALQEATASTAPVLLRCEDGVGHGPRALDRWLDLQADALAFCAHHTGLAVGSPPVPEPAPAE